MPFILEKFFQYCVSQSPLKRVEIRAREASWQQGRCRTIDRKKFALSWHWRDGLEVEQRSLVRSIFRSRPCLHPKENMSVHLEESFLPSTKFVSDDLICFWLIVFFIFYCILTAINDPPHRSVVSLPEKSLLLEKSDWNARGWGDEVWRVLQEQVQCSFPRGFRFQNRESARCQIH